MDLIRGSFLIYNLTKNNIWIQVNKQTGKISVYSLNFKHILQFRKYPNKIMSKWIVYVNNNIDALD